MQATAPPDWEAELLVAGELLLNGWGYNWYRAENLMRADDVLIRNHAESLLGEAEASVQRAVAAYRTLYLPAPSRECPMPEPVHLAVLRAAKAALAELDALRTRLRGASIPPDDKIWRRHRDEGEMLAGLGRRDAGLVGAARALRDEAASLDAEDLGGVPARLAPLIQHLSRGLEKRSLLLSPKL